MSQPQAWPRRQEVPQQWIPTEPTLMEKVERTNMMMVYPNQRVRFVQCNPMPWMWIRKIEIVIIAGELNIWLEIIGIEEQGIELKKEEDWNMDRTMDRG